MINHTQCSYYLTNIRRLHSSQHSLTLTYKLVLNVVDSDNIDIPWLRASSATQKEKHGQYYIFNTKYEQKNMNSTFFFKNLFSITTFSTELHISWKSPSWSLFQSRHLTVFYELLNLPYCWSLNLFVILTDHNKIPSPPCYHLFLTCHSIKTDLYLTNPLHPYILTSMCKFSEPFFIHFLWYLKGKFV